MWKMWKVVNINDFLSLKMWKKMCKRKNGMGFSNKHDDRKRFLGYVSQKTQS